MTSRDEYPHVIRQQREAATLRKLCSEYPHLRIDTELFCGDRVWVARGENGHPWLVASDDLARFRQALTAPTPQ
jgi:hypothetical protein